MVLHNNKWDRKATRNYRQKHGIANPHREVADTPIEVPDQVTVEDLGLDNGSVPVELDEDDHDGVDLAKLSLNAKGIKEEEFRGKIAGGKLARKKEREQKQQERLDNLVVEEESGGGKENEDHVTPVYKVPRDAEKEQARVRTRQQLAKYGTRAGGDVGRGPEDIDSFLASVDLGGARAAPKRERRHRQAGQAGRPQNAVSGQKWLDELLQ